jgi:hypothetical protein
MNFKSLVNEIGCDSRIKNGTLDLKNEDHVFVLQEYLEKAGYDINEIVDKTARLFEAGRFPERQAYNKDGILVTFPNKQYRDRAVNKGTHFAENPKKAQTNIFTADGEPEGGEQTSSEKSKSQPATLDQTLEKDIEGNKDTDERTPREKKQDAYGVEAILMGQTPLVNYSVDEAKKFGFYKKGFNWYDTEGSLIGEQIYDDSQSKHIIVADAISPSSYIKKAEKIINIINPDLLNKLEFLKNAEKTDRTKIFETIPILTAFGITDYKTLKTSGDYVDFAIGFLKEWGNLRTRLESISDTNAREENLKIYNLVDGDLKNIGGSSGVTLAQLGTPSNFIHASIKDFYIAADIYNSKFVKGKETKENTADIVLIYGGTKEDVFNALKTGNIESQDVDSMAKIKGEDIKFALISLKAGSARLGHVLTQLAQYVGQTISASPAEKSSSKKVKKEELNEGFLDTISNSIKNAIDKIKTIPEIAKNYFSSFINAINPFTTKITNFFFKELNADVNQLQSTELKNLERIENDLERELGTIDEGSSKCDKQHASYTSTVDKNLTLFKNVLKSNTEDISLINKITELSNNDSLIQFFPINIEKVELDSIKKLKENLVYTINQIQADFDINDCLERDTLRPIFKYRANILALKYLDLILNNVLKDVNTSDPNKIREEFIKLSSLLSSEAVFGTNVSLPLIKFTGEKIEKLKYKSNFNLEIPKKYNDIKLGKIKINVVPDEGYLSVNLYLFIGITMKDDIATPTYANYAMDSSSGSKFTFKVEGQKVVDKI